MYLLLFIFPTATIIHLLPLWGKKIDTSGQSRFLNNITGTVLRSLLASLAKLYLVQVAIDLYPLWCNGGKSAWSTKNYKQTSMFLCFRVRNYIKTHVCLYFPFSAYFYPPMDKGPLIRHKQKVDARITVDSLMTLLISLTFTCSCRVLGEEVRFRSFMHWRTWS